MTVPKINSLSINEKLITDKLKIFKTTFIQIRSN